MTRTKKPAQPTFTDDEIRQKVLLFLAERRKSARGRDALSSKISEIKSGLRPEGIGQNEVVRNLEYLVEHGWVREETINRPYTTPRGFQVPSEKHLYKLSDIGIRFTEGESAFDRSEVYSGININNVSGVVVVGSNNIVRNEFIDVVRELNRLESAVKMSDQLTDEQKVNVQADIQTAKNQLAKSQPERDILRTVVEGISFVGALPGVAEVFHAAKTAIEKLL